MNRNRRPHQRHLSTHIPSEMGTPEPATEAEAAGAALSVAMRNGYWYELWRSDQAHFAKLGAAALRGAAEFRARSDAATEREG